MSKYKTNTDLIGRIKRKFGTVQRFIERSGLSERSVRINLYRDSPGARKAQQDIARAVKETDPGGYLLTEEDRERIRLAIYRDYHNVTGFVEAHPQFSNAYMSYLLRGDVKFRKGKAEEIMKILKL